MQIVRFGSLAVPARAVPDFERALAYLRRDPGERALFARLEDDPHRLRLVVNARDCDEYDPQTRTIHWDPHSALRTTRGGRQSPALGLAHEVDHAVHDGPRTWRLAATPDPRYDTGEERRVVCGSERHAARTLGESVRTDHAGTTYRVAGPTER
jgi:hypothetical protein